MATFQLQEMRNSVAVGTWIGLLNGEAGAAMSAPHLDDRTVTVKGTFGAGGTVLIEGSNDGGVSWNTLREARGTGEALSFTAADTRLVLESPLSLRPRVAAGDGTTNITVIVKSS